MKYLIFIVVLSVSWLLAGCTGTVQSMNSVQATATPLPPGVLVETLPASSAETSPTATAFNPSPTATQMAATPSAAAQPDDVTATPPEPSATATTAPAEKPAAPTPTLLAPSPTPTEPNPVPPTLRDTPTPEAGQPTPASAAPPVDGSKPGAACEDKAAFYADVTVPDNTAFKQSEQFVKTWQIKNVGTCTWDGYQLVFGGGSILDAPLANPLPTIKPGELAEISIKLKAPNQGGVYVSKWKFQNRDGRQFGVNSGGLDYIWTKIAVTWYPDGATLPGVTTLPAPAGCTPQEDAGTISQLLGLINQARIDHNLKPLTLQSQLSAAAQVHSVDMACKDFVDHTGSDGSSWFDRIKTQKYSYQYASENIYVGDPAFGGDAVGAFKWWMNSQIHRDNILSSKITEIGIGYANYPKSTYKGYYTLDFARR